MAKDFIFDASDFINKMDALSNAIVLIERTVNMEMADTILVLSRQEVPLDKSTLMKSGHVDPYDNVGKVAQVSFNTDYAAFQHEGIRKDGTHAVTHRRNGRKAKYLEDPMKMNLRTLNNVAKDIFIEMVSVLQ